MKHYKTEYNYVKQGVCFIKKEKKSVSNFEIIAQLFNYKKYK